MARNGQYISLLRTLTGRRIVLPFYHAVSPVQMDHVDTSMFHVRGPALFDEDLDFFTSHFKCITAGELAGIIRSGSVPDRAVCHITFDDGLREVYDHALPLLEKYNVPATIFINTAFVDNRGLFYRYKVALLMKALEEPSSLRLLQQATGISDLGSLRIMMTSWTHKDVSQIDKLAEGVGIDFHEYLETYQPYLTSEQILDMNSRGVMIGSHTCDHPWFKHLELPDMKEQVLDSFKFIEQHYPIGDRLFSYPFSDEGVPADFMEWLLEDAGVSLSFGISGLKDDVHPRHLHRVPMEDSLRTAADILQGQYLRYLLKAPIGRNTIRRT